MPPLPKLGQGIPGGINTLLGLNNDPTGLIDPVQVPYIHPSQNTAPFIPLPAPAPVSVPTQGEPLSQIGMAHIAAGTTHAESAAYAVLKDPSLLAGAGNAVKQLIAQPTARLAHVIMADPVVMTNFKQLQPVVIKDLVSQEGHQLDTGAASQNQLINPAVAEAAGVLPNTGGGFTGWARHADTLLGQRMEGLGPGLARQAYGEGQDVGAALSGDTSFKHTTALGAALGHSYGQTIHDPIGQLKKDPIDFFANVATPFFLGAGGAARASELSHASELAGEAGTSTARQVAKTLIRPQPQSRTIRFGGAPASHTYTPGKGERGVERALAGHQDYSYQEFEPDAPGLDTIRNEVIDKVRNTRMSSWIDDRNTAKPWDMAMSGIWGAEQFHNLDMGPGAGPMEGKVLVSKTPDGKTGAIGGYTMAVSPDGIKSIHVEGVGSETPGAGISWFHQLAKQHPDAEIRFTAGSPNVERYYTRMGFEREGDEFVLPPSQTADWAAGNHPLLGTGELQTTPARNPMTIQPAAYKSALGGMVQKHILDPLLEKHMLSPTPYDRVSRKIAKTFRVPRGMMAPAGRFGRKVRQDMDNEIRINAHALGTRMPIERANDIARGQVFDTRHNQVYEAGITAGEAASQPWREWTPIKEPPQNTVGGKGGAYLTDADVKANPHLVMSERNMANQFERGSRMIPTRAEEHENPNQYRYVPSEMINGMRPYKPGTGSAATMFDVSDHVTQLIRSGRFLTPAYAQWAAQNGLIGLTQQGAFMFRNAWQLKREWPKLPEDVKGAMDGAYGKGIAKGTGVGGEASAGGALAQHMAGIQHFWHRFDDEWARRMSIIHELNHAGYHDAKAWTKLYRNDPSKFRRITAETGNDEAINYGEMTPAERATFQKLLTAYGWTRGASTYAARYPLMHPIQARVGLEIGKEGHQYVEDYYRKLHGMAPSWLQSYLPIGKSGQLGTEWLNPAGTAGGLIEQAPGLGYGQTEGLVGNLSPTTAAAMELITGNNKYGTPFKGTERLTGPIREAIHHFKPEAALETLGQTRQGGTFEQSPQSGGLQFAGIPFQNLRDPTKTAGLGQKDYEAALSTPDKIAFQYHNALDNLPSELAQYKHMTGQDLDHQSLSRLKGDLDAVEQRDIFQYHYAQSHHAKTWKALPPTNRLAGTLDWLAHHGYSSAQIHAIQGIAHQATADKQIDFLVNELWKGTGIGQVSSAWKSVVKGLNPPVITKANS